MSTAPLTLVVATAGGVLFAILHLPAPWLVGSIVSVAVLALTGAEVALPKPLQLATFLVTGVSMGSGITPESVAGILKWPASIASLAVAVVLMVALSAAYLRHFAKWDQSTAFFASVPGALSAVLVFAVDSKADVKLVMLAQMFRIFVLMAILPAVVMGLVPPSAANVSARIVSNYGEVALEMLAGAVLGTILHRLRFPGGLIIGGMLASAIIHGTGTFSGQMPTGVLIPCQIALGALIGVRFQNMDLNLLWRMILPSAGAFLVAALVSGVASVIVAWTLHFPLGLVLVAFAPGGLEAMAMLAFALGLDPAFVGVHQLARFLGLLLLLPVMARIYGGSVHTEC
jgi:membrane AbrB-like protein